MPKRFFVLYLVAILFGCHEPATHTEKLNPSFDRFVDRYYEERLKLYPLEGTFIGDHRYSDRLANDGSSAFLRSVDLLSRKYLDSLNRYERENLTKDQQLSFDVLSYQLGMVQEGLQLQVYFDYYHFAHHLYMPFNQMVSLPLMMAQMASGTSLQPFNTIADYDNWLKRLQHFSTWTDTAIANMNKGIASGIVFPKAIVLQIIPQMEEMAASMKDSSIFYGPILHLPDSFPANEKQRLANEYRKAISVVVEPAYKKLADYLKNEYVAHASESAGMLALPGGKDLYAFMVKQNTTTSKTPLEIYQVGLGEVARIRKQMDSIRVKVGYRKDLKSFFEYMKNDKQFKPYSTASEVLNAFSAIHQRMQPQLRLLFDHAPKTRFEIKQTEAFRAKSASAEYNAGSADGSRPGVFYVPILNAKEFNVTSGMESLFLHEAIPGHHYQISLTQENTALPKFRRYSSDNAYVEGWALYCESLGRDLGLYADPYQAMGALGDEMHRAIRLVVDVAIHAKGMTRESAIKYMMENEAISEQGATAEIERYMSNPGQALGYKIGALKIRELRTRAEQALGTKFSLAAFHHEILKDGSMPLSILEKKIDEWIDGEK